MFRRAYKTRYFRVVLKARTWKRVPMKILKWGRKMPSTKQYNLVPNDEYDTRIPLHPDEAFTYGITFQAKVSYLYPITKIPTDHGNVGEIWQEIDVSVTNYVEVRVLRNRGEMV